MHASSGHFTDEDAARIYHASLLKQKIDHTAELNHYDRMRIHNLKYYTWIEQQGKNLDELNAQWYDRDYWTAVQKLTPKINALIEDFNKKVGLLDA